MSGRGKALKNLELIAAAAAILQEIHPASVRAVCYRLFTMGLITSMSRAETNRVGTQLRDAREDGTIPWAWIVDETREAVRISAWADPAAFLETVRRSYRRDRWTDQPEWIEIWSEKGTIRGTLAPVLHEFGVTLRVMHGFSSSTTIYAITEETRRSHKPLTVFYLGDWDPSGLHMSHIDLPARIEQYGGVARIVRLALRADDLDDLPSFSAETKAGDPRHRWFVNTFGPTCYEIDALSPVILRARVEQAIVEQLDQTAWDRAEITEAAERESMASILSAWPLSISQQASKYSEGPER